MVFEVLGFVLTFISQSVLVATRVYQDSFIKYIVIVENVYQYANNTLMIFLEIGKLGILLIFLNISVVFSFLS